MLRGNDTVGVASTVDITSVLHTVVTLPQRIEMLVTLERALIVCGMLVVLVGMANAFLLLRLLAQKERAPVPAPVAPEPVPVGPPVAATAAVALPPAVALAKPVAQCACGAAISVRSKTGRCRACALRQRTAQRPAPAAVEPPIRFPARAGRSRGETRHPTHAR